MGLEDPEMDLEVNESKVIWRLGDNRGAELLTNRYSARILLTQMIRAEYGSVIVSLSALHHYSGFGIMLVMPIANFNPSIRGMR